MAIPRSDRATDPAGPPTGRRLESWKEIAAYLKRTVRTVHRWEKNEGLPVHRHLHRKQGTIYAYTAEIDAWWRDRAVHAEPASPGRSRRGLVAVMAVTATIAVIALAGYLLWAPVVPPRPTGDAISDSIAVLPFQALGADESDELLAYGIAEEVLGRLAEAGTLTVIARTSAFAFREQSLDPADVAERLRVKYLLVGHLQREGEAVRVRARLLDAEGRQLWSGAFDRSRRGLFEIQDEIAAAVVASIAPQLEKLREPGDRPHPDAYQYYLLGREHLGRGALGAAGTAFRQAIGLDPQFSRPYGGLAMVQALQSGAVGGRVNSQEARATAEHALRLDPELADAHAALGRISHAEGGLAEAHTLLRRALQLDPNLVDARLWLSANLMEQGRYAESELELQKALAIDPLHAELNNRLASLYWSRGDYAAAERIYRRILDLPDPPLRAYDDLVLLNRDFGRLDEALKWGRRGALEEVRAWSSEGRVMYLDGLVLAYNRLGMAGEAGRWLERIAAAQGSAWLGVRSEFLYTLGRFEEVRALNAEHLRSTGRPLQELPFLIQQVVGGFQVLTGRYTDGIEVLEPLFARPFRIPEGLPTPGHRGDFELMFAQFLAYAYQQVERNEDAERVLERVSGHIQKLRLAGIGQWPNLYVVEARNHALRGETSAALAALRQAVNKGWRDYTYERHNPCWQSLREEPQYQSLMALVEADVAAQRERVRIEGKNELEARILAALGDASEGRPLN
jgi:TolB-like protein/Flp pilus assembly protein TadD